MEFSQMRFSYILLEHVNKMFLNCETLQYETLTCCHCVWRSLFKKKQKKKRIFVHVTLHCLSQLDVKYIVVFTVKRSYNCPDSLVYFLYVTRKQNTKICVFFYEK